MDIVLKVMRLGLNPYWYIVPCVVSKGRDYVVFTWDYTLDAVVQSLIIWTSALFVIHFINMAAAAVLTLISISKSYRTDFVKR